LQAGGACYSWRLPPPRRLGGSWLRRSSQEDCARLRRSFVREIVLTPRGSRRATPRAVSFDLAEGGVLLELYWRGGPPAVLSKGGEGCRAWARWLRASSCAATSSAGWYECAQDLLVSHRKKKHHLEMHRRTSSIQVWPNALPPPYSLFI
jgi:hypothetical protein